MSVGGGGAFKNKNIKTFPLSPFKKKIIVHLKDPFLWLHTLKNDLKEENVWWRGGESAA